MSQKKTTTAPLHSLSPHTEQGTDKKRASFSAPHEAQMLTELKQLLEENVTLTKELEARLTKVNHWIVWQWVFTWLKVIIIVIPLALGIIYLPPLISEWLQLIRELLQNSKHPYGF